MNVQRENNNKSIVGAIQQREEWRNSSFRNQLDRKMLGFWKDRMSEIRDNPTDVRGAQTLPLGRIRNVMKSDERVKMVGADTPMLLAKACEMFIMELSQRAWIHTEQNKRKTLRRNDLANAIRDEGLLAFLENVVPMEKAYYQEVPVSYENLQYGAPMTTHTNNMNRSGFWQ